MTPAEGALDHETREGLRPLAQVGSFVGTILVIIALAVLPLLTPLFVHPALDAADSSDRLGLSTDQTHLMSDRSVTELVLGPGSFDFAGPDGQPFYDAGERSHLGDARLLLWITIMAGAISATAIGVALVRADSGTRDRIWGVVGRAGAFSAIAVIVLGVVSLVAFDTLFTLFHEVFFPGGNFTFDPATQHLVQLYPFTFWQIASAGLGVLVVLLGILAWLLGRRLGRSDITEPGGDA